MVVYFLVVEKEISDNLTKNQLILSSITHHENNINAINFNQLDATDTTVYGDGVANRNENFSKSSASPTDNSISGSVDTSLKNLEMDMSNIDFEPVGEVDSTTSFVPATKVEGQVPGYRNTQILEISTPKLNKEFVGSTDTEDDNTETRIMFPTKETLEFFGFTSGHQNNFGVPIEEDERILRMLNEQLIRREKDRNGSDILTTTTDGYAYRTRVSPTLPVINKSDVTTERLVANSTDEGSKKLLF